MDESLFIPQMDLPEAFVFINYFQPLEDYDRKKLKLEPLMIGSHDELALSFYPGEICSVGFVKVEEGVYFSEGCSD